MPGIARERSRWRWRIAMAAIAALAALWGVALATRDARGATGDGCAPACVILIQVDGLEPKDVTQQTTPFLWLLAHPTVQGQNVLGSALAGRSGWIWQAPRSVMSTGTASATASLLSGGYTETTGVPADDFLGPTQDSGGALVRQRLTADGFGDRPAADAPDAAQPIDSLGVSSVIQEADKAAVFLGDPGLAQLTDAVSKGVPHWFPPGDETSATNVESQYTGSARLCPIPHYLDGGSQLPNQPSQDNYDPRRCPADDATTLNKAISDLKQPISEGVDLTFIHLAELGAAKRLAGDPDIDLRNAVLPPNTAPPPSPSQALSDMDEAIGSFIAQYAQAKQPQWDKTVLMVVGTHGYQPTPLSDRVPDPENPGLATSDVTDYINKTFPSVQMVPQGTMATIYYRSDADPAARADTLSAVKQTLEGSAVKDACNTRDAARGPCVHGVYYVDKDAPDAESRLASAHADWRMQTRDIASGKPTGAGGDLVVEFDHGWAVGRAAGTIRQATLDGQPFLNPNTASSGGPEERPMAAIVDGPGSGGPYAVRNLDSLATSQAGLSQLKYYPVATHPVDTSNADNPPPVDPQCPDTPTDPGGLACANDPSKTADDANAAGHEAQPETVDFATTISALMQLPFADHPTQLQGRVLQEAFINQLARPCLDCEPDVAPEPEPEPPPLPPPPPTQIERSEGFNFHGLVRDLKALVVDAKDHPYAKAKRGAQLSTIRIEGDFGKPESAVTLTFYRAAAASSRKGRRTLKAIVHFDPFVVKRGHVKIRLQIPPMFHPQYIGLTVREVARGAVAKSSQAEPCTTVKTRKPTNLRCIGPARGMIVPIADAVKLHHRKGAGGGRRKR